MSLWCKKCGSACCASGHYFEQSKDHKAQIVSSHTEEGRKFMPIILGGYN